MLNDSQGEPAIRRVLVVEDDEDSAAVLALLIGSQGHHVETAADGYTALELCTSAPPHVVLCDLSLGGMSGYEFAEELRRRSGGEQMLLVALTGWAGDEVAARCRKAGFDGHLIKPIQDFQALLTLVSKLEVPVGSRLA